MKKEQQKKLAAFIESMFAVFSHILFMIVSGYAAFRFALWYHYTQNAIDGYMFMALLVVFALFFTSYNEYMKSL